MESDINYNEIKVEYYLEKSDELLDSYLKPMSKAELDILIKDMTDDQKAKFCSEDPRSVVWPDDPKEAFENVLKQCYAKHWLLAGEIVLFLKKFHLWIPKAMEQELDKINQFISEANKIDLEKAYKNPYRTPKDSSKMIYARIVNQYYDNKEHHVRNYVSEVKSVYGRYFLFKELLEEKLKSELSKLPQLKHLLKIPTKATPDEILDFWLRLTGNNAKGDPYWENEKEIEHFVYQNFDVFPGVDEIKFFNPNMNRSELSQVTWTFYHTYGMSKGKKPYEKLLMQNFTKFKDGKNVYSNTKYGNIEHLRKLYKEFPIK